MQSASRKEIKVYVGASLFSGRETAFNAELAERLERKGYPVILPQRDGFEFTGLRGTLAGLLRADEVEEATKNLIYLLDIGRFIPASSVITANWDQPIDEGLVVEVDRARTMGKFVVGYRTDVRSPYGTPTDRFGGMHDFPALQNDVFIKQIMPNQTASSASTALDELAGKIDAAISSAGISTSGATPRYVIENPALAKVIDLAERLFQGMDRVSTAASLQEIAARYVKNKASIEAMRPRIL